MMEEISALAKSRGYRSTRHGSLLSNVASNRLYERMGYERLGVHLNGEFLYLLTFPNEEK